MHVYSLTLPRLKFGDCSPWSCFLQTQLRGMSCATQILTPNPIYTLTGTWVTALFDKITPIESDQRLKDTIKKLAGKKDQSSACWKKDNSIYNLTCLIPIDVKKDKEEAPFRHHVIMISIKWKHVSNPHSSTIMLWIFTLHFPKRPHLPEEADSLPWGGRETQWQCSQKVMGLLATKSVWKEKRVRKH